MYVCMHACMHACMYTYTLALSHAHKNIRHTCIHACMSVFTRAHTHTHTHTHTYTHTHIPDLDAHRSNVTDTWFRKYVLLKFQNTFQNTAIQNTEIRFAEISEYICLSRGMV
jgi:hypothetical protein